MTPSEQKQFNDMSNQLKQVSKKLDDFLNIYYRNHFIDKDVWDKNQYFNQPIYLKDGNVVNLGGNNGSKIGISTDKLGFFGTTPVSQQSAITAPSGGTTQDAQARSSINSIITTLTNLGLTL